MRNDRKNPRTHADLEPGIGYEPVGKKKAARFNSPVCIHVHSLRYRLADADGVCCKYAIDGLIKAGILSDDSPKEVLKVSFSQEKIKKHQPEMTHITIKEVIP
jgi:hypothetical protein